LKEELNDSLKNKISTILIELSIGFDIILTSREWCQFSH